MAGSEVISALGAGSGFDTASIVDVLVAAERAPKQAQIDRGIEQSKSKISAYGVVTASLNGLSAAFAELKDSSDFKNFTVNNQATDDFLITASVDAEPGSHTVNVGALATAQVTASTTFSSPTESLNSGSDIVISIEVSEGDAEIPGTAGISTTDDTIRIPAHGYVTGDVVRYEDGSNGSGTAIGGLVHGTDYYAIRIDENSFMLATTLSNAQADTAVDLTSLGNDAQSFTRQSSTHNITIESPTPQQIVTTINASGLNINAQLFDLGTGVKPYQITLTGASGATNDFNASSDSGDVAFVPTNLVEAGNAVVTVDGLSFERKTNEITDILAGTTISLQSTSSTDRQYSVDRDTAPVEAAIRNLVATFNDVQTIFNGLKTANEDSEDELAGSLASDSTFRFVRNAVREMVTSVSSTPSGNVNYFSDLGVSVTRTGNLQIDEEALSSALTDNFSDMVQALSAGTDDQSELGVADRGLAGDASKRIVDLISSSGPIRAVTDNADDRSAEYEIALADLDDRMVAIRARYVAQFSAMESLVDQMNNTREYLKTQLDNLPFTNRDN